MRRFPWLCCLLALLCLTNSNPAVAELVCDDCQVELKDDRLLIENRLFAREYDWNSGNIISRRITNKSSGQAWELTGDQPDFSFPVESLTFSNDSLKIEKIKATNVFPAHLQIDIHFSVDSLQIKRRCRLYHAVAALGCEFYLRGKIPQSLANWNEDKKAGEISRKMVENPHARESDRDYVVIERLNLPGQHWQLEAVAFDVATDYNDTLVQHQRALTFRKDHELRGNLLILNDTLGDGQFFILKESPSKGDQLYYPGYDFLHKHQDIRVVGLGIAKDDVERNRWTRSYGVVTGVVGPGRLAVLNALRQYQNHTRRWLPERDDMILMNTWGDRSRDGRVNESFIIRELAAASALGITHFQIDDGWQAGLSANSASASGNLWSNWADVSWNVHPERFPNGLAPVVAEAKKNNIALGIWFNPSSHQDYANWKRDADILLGLYREHGIAVFKIDGIEIPSKTAEKNLRRFFERVQTKSRGDVVFNLDVTAGRRSGYHHMIEYGNIFLENRYTDWANYYPYRTLRNLWMLSAYVPPQRLQIEFLNKWRNADKYQEKDPFAPERLPFDYIFAITMMAQPLAWFEATGLPAEAQGVAPLIKAYREIQADIHRGNIFPIGERPNGTSWTGFQSVQGDRGYILVLREFTRRRSATLSTWLPANASVKFDHLLGHGANFSSTTDSTSQVRFQLPSAHSFALYRYQAQP